MKLQTSLWTCFLTRHRCWNCSSVSFFSQSYCLEGQKLDTQTTYSSLFYFSLSTGYNFYTGNKVLQLTHVNESSPIHAVDYLKFYSRATPEAFTHPLGPEHNWRCSPWGTRSPGCESLHTCIISKNKLWFKIETLKQCCKTKCWEQTLTVLVGNNCDLNLHSNMMQCNSLPHLHKQKLWVEILHCLSQGYFSYTETFRPSHTVSPCCLSVLWIESGPWCLT